MIAPPVETILPLLGIAAACLSLTIAAARTGQTAAQSRAIEPPRSAFRATPNRPPATERQLP